MIYTAIVGNFDLPRSDIPVFTGDLGMVPRLASRFYKTCPHFWFHGPTCYVDGNISVQGGFEAVLQLLGDADLAIFAHPYWNTIRRECAEVAIGGFDTASLQHDFADFLDVPGLFECGVLIRAYNERVKRLNEIWWSLICRYSQRDQLTFPIALKAVPDLKVNVLAGSVRNHPQFKFVPRGTI